MAIALDEQPKSGIASAFAIQNLKCFFQTPVQLHSVSRCRDFGLMQFWEMDATDGAIGKAQGWTAASDRNLYISQSSSARYSDRSL